MSEYFWILILFHLANIVYGRDVSFAPEWRGSWYQSVLGEIQITADSISHRGVLVYRFDNKEKNKYILWNKTKLCYRCLVFTPQHANLLQYKESMCYPETESITAFTKLCSTITGDFQLHTLVKVTSIPVPCPFQGPYSFTYNNGFGDCHYPTSEIHACADESKFKIHTQHCPSVYDTHDRVIHFQCLATWDNGGNFLYGKLTGDHIERKEEMYRCFMYEIYGRMGNMAMSADATCLGLQSSSIGSFTWEMSTEIDRWPQPTCTFIDMFNHKHHWRDINGKYVIELSENGQKFKLKRILNSGVVSYAEVTTETLMSIKCAHSSRHHSNSKEYEIIAHTTNDTCSSYYHCVRIKRRSDYIIEVSFGSPIDGPNSRCSKRSDWVLKMTMFPERMDRKTCPPVGIYTFQNDASKCEGRVNIGCAEDDEIVFETACPSNKYHVDYWQCLHTWREDSKTFLLVRKPGDPRNIGTCMTFAERGNSIELTRLPGCSDSLAPADTRDSDILHLNLPPAKCQQMKPKTVQSDQQQGEKEDATKSVEKQHIIRDYETIGDIYSLCSKTNYSVVMLLIMTLMSLLAAR